MGSFVFGLLWKPYPRWETSPNKAPPPKLSQTVPPTRDQAFKCPRLWEVLLNPPQELRKKATSSRQTRLISHVQLLWPPIWGTSASLLFIYCLQVTSARGITNNMAASEEKDPGRRKHWGGGVIGKLTPSPVTFAMRAVRNPRNIPDEPLLSSKEMGRQRHMSPKATSFPVVI